MMPYLDVVLVAVTIAGLLALVLTTLRGKPIVSPSGFRFLRGDPEVSTPFAGLAFVLLGLLAIGDADDVLEPIGSPVAIAAVLGAVTGFASHRWLTRVVFQVLSALGVLTSVYRLFLAPDSARPGAAGMVLGVLVLGVVLGTLVWPDLRPTTVAAKACAVVTLTRFLIAPGGLDLIGGATSTTVVLLGVAAVWGAVLLALPGPGVAALLGIGSGLAGLWLGMNTGAGLDFLAVFVLVWLVVAGIRRGVAGRTGRGARA